MTAEIPRRGSIRPITDLPVLTDPTGGALEIEKNDIFYQVNQGLIGGADPALAPPSPALTEDDEFNASVLDPKWSWLNQGSSTAPLYLSRALLKFQASGNAGIQRVAAIVQVVPPSSAQTWAAVIRMANYSVEAGLGGGPFAYRSNTGQFVTFNSFRRSVPASGPYTEQWAATRWTDFATPVANPYGPVNVDEGRLYNYFQLRNDGTSLYFDFSPDMVQWINLGSVTLATGLGGDCTHFGIGGNAASVASQALLGVDWFRVRYSSTLQP